MKGEQRAIGFSSVSIYIQYKIYNSDKPNIYISDVILPAEIRIK